jgi:hypothetical protein
MRQFSGRLGLLTLFGLFHVAATPNERSTEVTVGAGGGKFEYVPGGCGSFRRGAEIASYASVRHEFEGHLVVDGSLTLAPGVTETVQVTTGGAAGESTWDPHFIGGLTARVGGRWPWGEFMVGPALYYHPEIGGPVPLPSANLKLGPDHVYVWASAFDGPAWSTFVANVRGGLGTRGRLGELQLGVLAPKDEVHIGAFAQGQAWIGDTGWRLGGQAGVHPDTVIGGPDWRLVLLATKRFGAAPDPAE